MIQSSSTRFRMKPTLVANPPLAVAEKTVVVLGAFRGGTSMVARSLLELGVFMGETFAPPDPEYENFEDQEFQSILHRRELLTRRNITPADFSTEEITKLRRLIEKRDSQHETWGWKYPGTVLWCLHAGLARYLRNPHFVSVFRDPLAIFQHELDKECIKADRLRLDKGRSFPWIGLQNDRLIEHVMQAESPHLLLSYERVMIDEEKGKQELSESLTEFLSPALRVSQGKPLT